MEGAGVCAVQQAAEGLVYFRGRGHAGVAQREVKDVVPAHDFCPLVPVLKQLPNDGASLSIVYHLFIWHSWSPSYPFATAWDSICSQEVCSGQLVVSNLVRMHWK